MIDRGFELGARGVHVVRKKERLVPVVHPTSSSSRRRESRCDACQQLKYADTPSQACCCQRLQASGQAARRGESCVTACVEHLLRKPRTMIEINRIDFCFGTTHIMVTTAITVPLNTMAETAKSWARNWLVTSDKAERANRTCPRTLPSAYGLAPARSPRADSPQAAEYAALQGSGGLWGRQ
jgi:hypothetical protein